MAEQLIYWDTNVYQGQEAMFNALASIPNFWDEIHDDYEESFKRTLVKGGITIEISALQTKGVSGYGRAFTVNFENHSTYMIAATSTGLIFDVTRDDSTGYFQGIALNVDKNGDWGAAKITTTTGTSTRDINDIIAPDVSSTTFNLGVEKETPQVGGNTQIVDLMSTNGDFIFEDLRWVILAPNAVKNYDGKLTMPNGEKYVKLGSAALRYRE